MNDKELTMEFFPLAAAGEQTERRKKRIVTAVIVFLSLLVLLTPLTATYKDGGTRTYTALLYKVIVWRPLEEGEDHKTGTEVYIFPDNFHDLDFYA
ncbi:hypothetical protein [Zongyangia hominis]|uniref:Uncharacterized protein n=1 Tax=Zongyangia hominis TaxID=2763677 RepID=A0A926EC68_9FIRM|nr:hypothetical protein [Zongyangia hominis]MBC8569674.1 hypothetical protein [Zongyangia hominis]